MTPGGLLSRSLYYLSSIPTILGRMKDPLRILALFLGLPASRPFVVEIRGGARFGVRTRMDVWLIKEVCLDRDYERGFTALEPGWTILDVGAGFGEFAVDAALRFPTSRVLAFEPDPDSLRRLRENASRNGVTNLQAFPDAIAGAAGTLPLYTVSGLYGQYRTVEQRPRSGPDPFERRLARPDPGSTVSAVTLADVFDHNGIASCDFLKMDCEGAEYGILLATDEATLGRIRRVAMEYHDGMTPHRHDELVRFLEERGFDVRTRGNPAHRELGLLFAVNRRPAGPPPKG